MQPILSQIELHSDDLLSIIFLKNRRGRGKKDFKRDGVSPYFLQHIFYMFFTTFLLYVIYRHFTTNLLIALTPTLYNFLCIMYRWSKLD